MEGSRFWRRFAGDLLETLHPELHWILVDHVRGFRAGLKFKRSEYLKGMFQIVC